MVAEPTTSPNHTEVVAKLRSAAKYMRKCVDRRIRSGDKQGAEAARIAARELAKEARRMENERVAPGLPGEGSADELRRLAEVFEVRDALTAMPLMVRWCVLHYLPEHKDDANGSLYKLAERLHAAGWRPDMSAEDAARMLAQP